MQPGPPLGSSRSARWSATHVTTTTGAAIPDSWPHLLMSLPQGATEKKERRNAREPRRSASRFSEKERVICHRAPPQLFSSPRTPAGTTNSPALREWTRSSRERVTPNSDDGEYVARGEARFARYNGVTTTLIDGHSPPSSRFPRTSSGAFAASSEACSFASPLSRPRVAPVFSYFSDIEFKHPQETPATTDAPTSLRSWHNPLSCAPVGSTSPSTPSAAPHSSSLRRTSPPCAGFWAATGTTP